MIHSKPDRNQSKLTVCSVLDNYIVTAHQDQLIQDKPTSWTSESWQLAFAHPVDWKNKNKNNTKLDQKETKSDPIIRIPYNLVISISGT